MAKPARLRNLRRRSQGDRTHSRPTRTTDRVTGAESSLLSTTPRGCHPVSSSWDALLAQFQDVNCLSTCVKQHQTNQRNVRAFLHRAHVAFPSDITSKVIEAYLSDLVTVYHAGPKTVLNHKSCISGFCKFLRARHLIDRNPCADVICQRPPKLHDSPMIETHPNLDALLKMARELGLEAPVLLAICAGPRLSEIARMEWRDVNFVGRTIIIRSADGLRQRVVPLARMALEALFVQQKKTGHLTYVFPARHTFRRGFKYVDRPCSANTLLRQLKPIQDAFSEFKSMPAHSVGRGWDLFRHMFASRLIAADVPIEDVQDWLGHNDIKTTERFVHVARPVARRYDPQIEKVINLGTPYRGFVK